MKVTIISPFYYPNIIGGAEVSVKLIAQSLHEKGVSVRVISFDGKNYKEEYIDNIELIRYKMPKLFKYSIFQISLLFLVPKVMKKYEKVTDVYHIYNVFPLAGAGLYKKIKGKCPVVATLNNYAGFCPFSTAMCLNNNNVLKCNWFKRVVCSLTRKTKWHIKLFSVPYSIVYTLIVMCSKNIDLYISLSNEVKRIYNMNGYNENNIKIIPNFMHEIDYANDYNKKGNDVFRLIYVGNISWNKGVDVLIKAFSKLTEYTNAVELIIIGDGKYKKQMEDLSTKLGCNQYVKFHGKLAYNEVLNYYNYCHCFVHPGRWPEPFNRTLLEAMYFNLPCLVSNSGTPKEIVENAGLVFKSGDYNNLYKIMLSIIENSELYAELKSNCNKVISKYMKNKVVSEIKKVYYALASKV